MKASKLLLSALAAGVFFVFVSSAAIPAGYNGTPFPPGSAPRELPGRINFWDYDCGGLNVAFYADDRAGQGSWGGTPRSGDGATSWPAFYKTNTPWDRDTFYAEGVSWPNGVYYPNPNDTSIHNMYIGASHANSWTKWTVHVATAGKYWISSIFSSADQPFHFQINFINGTKTTTVNTPNFSSVPSYHAWKKFSDFASITLDTGVQVLYFQNQTGHLNQDFLYFASDSGQFATEIGQPAVLQNIYRGDFKMSVNRKSVSFTLPDAGKTKISVFDCLGREIQALLDRDCAAGLHTAAFSSKNLKQGVYFLHVRHNSITGVLRFQLINN